MFPRFRIMLMAAIVTAFCLSSVIGQVFTMPAVELDPVLEGQRDTELSKPPTGLLLNTPSNPTVSATVALDGDSFPNAGNFAICFATTRPGDTTTKIREFALPLSFVNNDTLEGEENFTGVPCCKGGWDHTNCRAGKGLLAKICYPKVDGGPACTNDYSFPNPSCCLETNMGTYYFLQGCK